MGALGRFMRSLTPGNDHQLAARDYPGHESASDEAARKRRERHRGQGSQRAAARGQRWDAKDRTQDRKGTWYRPA